MHTLRGLIIVIAIAAITGCHRSDNGQPSTPGTIDLGHEVRLTMRTSLSDAALWQTPPSRALTTANENAVSRLDVLVFNADDTFAYLAQASGLSVTGLTLSYMVSLKKSTTTEQYKLVLLANLPQAPTITPGTTKEQALAQITFTPTNNWIAGTTIPMWADYPNASVVTSAITNTSFGTTTLIRSLARINVVNSATSTFTLNAVHVYKSPGQARVAPALANFDRALMKVTAPSLPSGASTISTYSKGATANSVTNEIYMGELAPQTAGSTSAMCLVFQGTYQSASHYYRIDLINSGTTTVSILRNHTYTVNITKVLGPGYSSLEAAYNSTPINITSTVTGNSDIGITDMVTDGQYTLTVGRVPTLSSLASSGSIPYSSDHFSDPIVEKGSESWLTITSSGNSSPITFSVTANTDPAPRHSSITIIAGRITKRIAIKQSPPPAKLGDYYMSDGTLISGTSTLTPAQHADCIGIVYWTGDPGKNDAKLRANYPECTNGLVVALTDVATPWQSTNSSYKTLINTWVTAHTTYAPVVSDKNTVDPINKIMGYNNTRAIEAFNADPANSEWKVDIIEAVKQCRALAPGPATDSDWFMPSAKELTLLSGLEDPKNNNIYDDGYGTLNRDAINLQLAKISGAMALTTTGNYWSSTEYQSMSAWFINFRNGQTNNSSKVTAVNRARCVRAF